MEAVAQLETWRGRQEPVPVPFSAALRPFEPRAAAAALDGTVLDGLLTGARSLARTAVDDVRGLELNGSALFAARVEELSRAVEHLQVIAAGQLDRIRATPPAGAAGAHRTGLAGWTTGWSEAGTPKEVGITGRGDPVGSGAGNTDRSGADSRRATFAGEFRSSAEYLRVLLRISAGEARRRLALADAVLPRQTLTGQQLQPVREHLATALAGGTISSRAATIITLTLDKTPRTGAPETTTSLEQDLVKVAEHQDPDFLNRCAHRWLEALDPDGTEPSEEELRHTQGAFIRKPRHGLNHLEIFATQDQYEHLLTVMNTATNPRSSATSEPGRTNREDPDRDGLEHDSLDRRSRAQKLLDGLIDACKAALTTGNLPTAGGLRPQIMATINYQDLLNQLTAAGQHSDQARAGSTLPGTGTYTFTGPVPAATLRKLACDADIIPVVLGGEGQILDIGRASRVFPPHIRKAITTRDQGCAFPGCTIPAPWCEAHHITYWSHGGTTSTDNGTLLCSHHHHLIHKEHWRIHTKEGTPWFIPPPHIDPHQQPRQNHYFRC